MAVPVYTVGVVRSEVVVRIVAPLDPYPTPTQVGVLAVVQATWDRLVAEGRVVDDQMDPAPPQAAVAALVPFPRVRQVRPAVPGHSTPPSTAEAPP